MPVVDLHLNRGKFRFLVRERRFRRIEPELDRNGVVVDERLQQRVRPVRKFLRKLQIDRPIDDLDGLDQRDVALVLRARRPTPRIPSAFSHFPIIRRLLFAG